jgi:hypothetical protein
MNRPELSCLILAAVCGAARPGRAEASGAEGGSPNRLENTTFLQCANPGVPDHWGIMTGLAGLPGVFKIPDWTAESYQTAPESPVPGTHSLRMACQARVQSTPIASDPAHVYTLSVYLKAETKGTPVHLCIGDNTRTVAASPEWARHAFTGRPRESGHWRRNYLAVAFVVKGPGAVWLAAPQLERAQPAEAVRAKDWQGSAGSDYEVDERSPHSGRYSLRCQAAGTGDFETPSAEQFRALEAPLAQEILIGGWCKASGVPPGTRPHIEISLPQEDARERARPAQKVELAFSGGDHDWEHKELRLNPKAVVRGIGIRPRLPGREGTAWFDDLVLRPVGRQVEATPRPDAAAEPDAEADEENPDEKPGVNLIRNPGFEEVEKRQVVLATSVPSPYRPSDADAFQALLRKAGEPPSLECPVIAEPVQIDGRLNEPGWAKAAVIDRFAVSANGQPAASKTTCRAMRDAKQLYVAFTCHGTGCKTTGDAGAFDAGNSVAVELKPDPAQKWFYRAAVDACGNPEGSCHVDKPFSILTIGLQKPAQRQWPWKKGWSAAVQREDESWNAELAIPFAALRGAGNAGEWAFNLHRRADGEESSWCPDYRGSWKGEHWSSTFRAAAERFRFGTLRGMADIPATAPGEGVWRISNMAFQYQPGRHLALLFEVRNSVPLTFGEAPGTLQFEVSDPEGKSTGRAIPVRLGAGVQKVKAAELGLRPLPGPYRIKTKLTGPPEENALLDDMTTWQAMVYGHTCDENAVSPSLLFDRIYFPPLFELRALTEFSYYTEERVARLLVESGMSEDLRLTVQASCREPKSDERRELADAALPGNGRSTVLLDIAALAPGVYDLEILAADRDGKPKAAALAQLVKLPPSPVGTRVNRITGCLWVNGASRILHAASMPLDDCRIEFMKTHHLNALMTGLRVPEEGAEAAAQKVRTSLDQLHTHGLGVLAWLQGGNEDIVRTICSLQDHPAIVAWKIIDEPYGDPAKLLELYRAAKEADPYRPAFINWDHWYPGMGGCGSLMASDIGSRDAYPFGASSWVVDLARPMADMAVAFSAMGRDCVTHGKAAGFWQQIYGTDDAFREPTPAELRCCVFLSLVHRVRLTYYFTCIPMCVKLWETLDRLGREMELFNAGLSRPEAFELATGQQNGVHFSLWQTGPDASCLLLCNPAAKEVQFRLSLPLRGKTGLCVLEGLSRQPQGELRGENLQIKVSPYEAGIFSIQSAQE